MLFYVLISNSFALPDFAVLSFFFENYLCNICCKRKLVLCEFFWEFIRIIEKETSLAITPSLGVKNGRYTF